VEAVVSQITIWPRYFAPFRLTTNNLHIEYKKGFIDIYGDDLYKGKKSFPLSEIAAIEAEIKDFKDASS
jgi:hypothetical protein